MATVNPAAAAATQQVAQPAGDPPVPKQEGGSAAQQAAPAGDHGALPAKFAGTDQTISLTPAEYQQLLADRLKRTELEAIQADQSEKAFQDRQKLLLQLGQAEQALAEQKQRSERDATEWKSKYEATEKSALSRELKLVIKDALTGVEWINPAAGRQAAELLANRFESIRNPTTQEIDVLDRTSRRSAAEVIRDWLASEDASHMLKPKSADGGRPRLQQTASDLSQPPPPVPAEEDSFQGRVYKAWQENKNQIAANPLSWQGNVVDNARARRQQQSGNR